MPQGEIESLEARVKLDGVKRPYRKVFVGKALLAKAGHSARRTSTVSHHGVAEYAPRDYVQPGCQQDAG